MRKFRCPLCWREVFIEDKYKVICCACMEEMKEVKKKDGLSN